MSTYLYLECHAHNPALKADGESGQHLYDLPQIQADIANREAIAAMYADNWTHHDHFRRNTARFLVDHPHCLVVIVDEYGDRHPTQAETENRGAK